jgi:hypothetical protein
MPGEDIPLFKVQTRRMRQPLNRSDYIKHGCIRWQCREAPHDVGGLRVITAWGEGGHDFGPCRLLHDRGLTGG